MQTKATDGTTLTVTPALLPNTTELNVATMVIAEWNQNRYGGIASVVNGVGQQSWSTVFPISSIVGPFRPTSKITVGITDVSKADDNYTNINTITASEDAKYTYWVSNDKAGTTPVSGKYPITNVTPTILYTAQVWTNKITVTFDVTSALNAVGAFTIDITSNAGGAWTTVATTPAIDPVTGMVTLYRQANGTWGTPVYRENPVQINGIRINVTSMINPSQRVSLIEIAPKLESDLSAFVQDYSVDASMSETSFITPLGVSSGNTGSITLSNIDLRFNNNNGSSLYVGLLDKNVRITIDEGIKTGFAGSTASTSTDSIIPLTIPFTTGQSSGSAAGYEWVRQATMLSDVWSGQDFDSTQVRLQDDSAYLQAAKPPAMFIENIAPGAAIVSLLNSIGYSSYNYSPATDEIKIPYFWCDGEDTVWSIINKLAEPLQIACYFDEYGVLQIKPSKAAYNLSASTAWTFSGYTNSSRMADIADVQTTADYEANIVNVNYKNSHLTSNKYGYPAMETVWEPEGTVALRGRRLAKALSPTDMVLTIRSADSNIWPFKGIVRVENEYIQYDGKGLYVIYTNGTTAAQWVYTQEEYQTIMDRTDVSSATSFDGRLQVLKRGVFNSVATNHYIGSLTNRWTGTYGNFDWARETPRVWNLPMTINPNTGKVRVTTNNQFTNSGWFTMRNGAVANPIKTFASTRLRFPSYDPNDPEKTTEPYTNGIAGVVMCLSDTNDYGWYIDVALTEWIESIGARPLQNEISITHRPSSGGPVFRYGDGITPNPGVKYNIVKDQWYTLDARMFSSGPNTIVTVWMNGQIVINATVPLASYSGKWGLFARGYTVVDFEYAASTNGGNMIVPPDNSSFISGIHGGTQSQVLGQSFFTNYADPVGQPLYVDPYPPEAVRRADLYYDEFSPSVNEVREYDVKFTKVPVVHSRVFITNEEGVMVPEYTSTPFGAHFYVINNNRDDAIINGDDTSSGDINNPIQQKMLIYGRLVIQDDVKTVVVKNDAAIRRRGEVEVSIDSDFIQTETTATTLGKFITTHWSGGQDEVDLESFYNPLIQIGDVVAIDYPVINMTPTTHKYFVTGITREMSSEGPSRRYKLRRARI